MSDDAVVRFLADRGSYPHHPDAVEHVQTHISHVFLAGPYVYKLKKAVRLPFLDFGSAERRHRYCLEEVRLNRRLSPAVYLDVLPIVRRPDGRLALGGDGEAVDHVVWMRRLPADRLLVNLVRTGRVTDEMIDALAMRLATFHATAGEPETAVQADPEHLRARWDENVRESAVFIGSLIRPEDHEVLVDFGPSFVRTHETLLRARQHGGRIREGHGDLQAGHVCFVDAPIPAPGQPPLSPGIYVFDCIEFSAALRSNDIAYEAAFLAMDLESLGRPELARRFVAAHAAAANDPLAPILLPFFASHLAAVRGKVEGLKSMEPEVEPADRAAAAERARQRFALAVRYAWNSQGPAVIACSGLSGSGKTVLAAELADTTGFTLLATDVLRKRRATLSAATVGSYGRAGYSDAAREAVYEVLCAEAARVLATGNGVVADATFIRRADRGRLAAVAREHGRPLIFIECQADEAVIRTRLEARLHTAPVSDARWETYLAQRMRREPFATDERSISVDTSAGIEEARCAAVRPLWRWRQGRWTGS